MFDSIISSALKVGENLVVFIFFQGRAGAAKPRAIADNTGRPHRGVLSIFATLVLLRRQNFGG